MRILVNAATCIVGGGVQVAASFIKAAMQDDRHHFSFVISSAIGCNLDCDHLSLGDRFLLLSSSPAHPLKGRKTRTAISTVIRTFNPNIVFTVFGPSYQNFCVPHVCGYARGWDTHPSKIALHMLRPITRMRYQIARLYRFQSLSKRDFFWTETEISRRGLVLGAGLNPDSIRVIPNCYSPFFEGREYGDVTTTPIPFRVLTIASPYIHKRLPFIVDVASFLKSNGLENQIRFRVTLPEFGKEVSLFWKRAEALGVTKMIENIGIINIQDCPAQYAEAHCIFLPSVLETFSVSYLEAMKTKRPIVTSDLDFARDLCGDAAEYFDPQSSASAAQSILRLMNDQKYLRDLVAAGSKRLSVFFSPEEKYEAHIAWLEKVVTRSNTKTIFQKDILGR